MRIAAIVVQEGDFALSIDPETRTGRSRPAPARCWAKWR